MARYPEGHSRQVIVTALEHFARTRRSGVMAATLVNAFLRWSAAYPVDRVVAALTTYIDRDCAGEGKAEAYAKGIIRNQKAGGNGHGRTSTDSSASRADGQRSGWVKYADADGNLTPEQERNNRIALRSLGVPDPSQAPQGGDGVLPELSEADPGADVGDWPEAD
jgi:hypothetical protein